MLFGAYPYPAKDLQELTNKVNRDPLNFPSIPPSQDSELLSYLVSLNCRVCSIFFCEYVVLDHDHSRVNGKGPFEAH